MRLKETLKEKLNITPLQKTYLKTITTYVVLRGGLFFLGIRDVPAIIFSQIVVSTLGYMNGGLAARGNEDQAAFFSIYGPLEGFNNTALTILNYGFISKYLDPYLSRTISLFFEARQAGESVNHGAEEVEFESGNFLN